VHDGITIEKAGKPAAVICTEPFIPTGRAIARIRGIEDYPLSIVPHPVGSLDEDGVMLRARQALPRIMEILQGRNV
jgi:hypothetical protein